MSNDQKVEKSRGYRIAFWIAVLRGVFAVFLGLALIFNPEKNKAMLANFMGVFWLTTGILLLRHTSDVFGDQTDRALGRKTTIVIGIIFVLTGLLVISRSISRRWIDEVVLIELLGGVILLTGLLHLVAVFRAARVIKIKHIGAEVILAVFEIVLGALLIFSPLEQGPIVYWSATIWALVGGIFIIIYAFIQRAQSKRDQNTIREQSDTIVE